MSIHIQQATIKNFMGIELVEIVPDGGVQLAGNNGQGKTSVMLAIIGALGGKKALAKALGLSADPGDEAIIRRGEEMAEVVVEFGGYVVTWQRERGKSDKVEIRGADDGIHGRKKLGDLIGAIAFDPLEFNEMSPATRRAMLLELVGIDLEEIDGRREAAYQRRRDVNRDHKQALARVGDAIDGAPEEAVDVAALELRLEEAQEQGAWNLKQHQEAMSLGTQAGAMRDRAEDVEREIAKIQAVAERAAPLHQSELTNMDRRHANEREELERKHQADLDGLSETIAKARENHGTLARSAENQTAAAKAARRAAKKLADPPLDPIKRGIEAAREANELYRLAQERLGRQAEAEKLGTESRDLTVSLGEIDTKKATLLADAKMPIEGLGVSNDDATIDGHLWETTEFSRRLRVCVAISAALSGELKIAFVRSGNDLDDESYAAFCAECERLGLQPWVERIVPGAGAIVIESGLVAS